MGRLDQIRRIAFNPPELKKLHLRSAQFFLLALLFIAGLTYWIWPARPPEALLNIAFDASQPLFALIDPAWQERSGTSASSLHAGSIQQSEALVQGLAADTICVASAWELDSLARNGRTGLVTVNWREQFPLQASPFHSTLVFLVRREIEERLQDWTDLLEGDLRYGLPSPDVSGAGYYAYLTLAYTATRRYKSHDWIFSGELDRAVFLPHGARRVTERFLRDRSLDLLITWESEALRALKAKDSSAYSIIYPKLLIRIDPVVAIAEIQTKQRGTRENAESYLNFLFSPEARNYIEAVGFRPNLAVNACAGEPVSVRIDSLFGSWQNAIDLHLSPNGTYHRLIAYRKARAGGSE